MAGDNDPGKQDTISLFLELPTELRNDIYRLVLVRPKHKRDVVTTIDTIPKEPALLLTCRQIRGEALGIYFRENKFTFRIRDCDAEVYLKWCVRSKHHLAAAIEFVCEGSPNWRNFKIRLRAHHYDRARALRAHPWPGESKLKTIMRKVFGISKSFSAPVTGPVMAWSL
ncbi:hypothetical protein Slin15195_G120040 [Septoria linicola]|uniref:F-box domain-containing protein n=1 Tax=Septoria linicola TaxID=215465 RepID=A0A9Q9B119_9PEZI|nr:hypothetical protein Slin15195_G120040 [Septoria linicola]